MLNDKQEKFKNLVLKKMLPEKAYVKAGYAARGKVAVSAAHRLLKNVEIQQEINKVQQKAATETGVTVERLIREERCLAFCDITQIVRDSKNGGSRVHPRDLPEDVRRALSGIDVVEAYAKGGDKVIKYKYRFWDKGRAIERLERHLGMFEEKASEEAQPPSVVLNLSGNDTKVQINLCKTTPKA